MFGIYLIAFLTYSNFSRARKQGKAGGKWAVLTFFSSLAGLTVGCMFVMLALMPGAIQPMPNATFQQMYAANSKQVTSMLMDHPFLGITLDLFSVGGYLLVRYFLDKSAGKNQDNKEVHWMEKYGRKEEQ